MINFYFDIESMRRQLLTMIFIFSLVIYQYGKIVSYIGCKISEITSTISQCDCEKFGSDVSNTNTTPVQKSVIKEKAEDFFTCPGSKVPQEFSYVSTIKKAPTSLALATGCSSAIFQPPRS